LAVLYLLIGVYLISLVIKFDLGTQDRRKADFHFLSAGLILFLIAALRFRMAPDTVWYMTYFDTEVEPLSRLTYQGLMEARYQPAWTLLASACKSIGNYYVMQFAVAGVSTACFLIFISKACLNRFTALTLFYLLCFFYFSMEVLRESMAVGFFLLCVLAYNARRYRSAFAFWVVATLFHQYAVFLGLALFLAADVLRPKVKIALMAGFVAALLLIGNPIDYFYRLLLSAGLTDLLSYDVQAELSWSGYLYNILRCAPCLFIMFKYRDCEIDSMRLRKSLVFTMCGIYVVLVIIRMTILPFADRFTNYFIFFPILLVSSAIYEEIRALRLPSAPTASVLFIVVGVFYVLPLLAPHSEYNVPTYKRYYPYHTIFSEDVDEEREYITRYEGKE
jgi:hypothetical protein